MARTARNILPGRSNNARDKLAADLAPTPQIFRNYSPIVPWIGAALAGGFLSYVTYTALVAHDTSIFRISISGAVFLAVCAIAVVCFRTPLLSISVAPEGVTVRETWLWRSRESCYAAAELSVPDISEGSSMDGGPCFECRLRLPDGRMLLVYESSYKGAALMDRHRLESALARYHILDTIERLEPRNRQRGRRFNSAK